MSHEQVQASSRLHLQMIESVAVQKNRSHKIYFSIPDQVDLNELDLFVGQLDESSDKQVLITVTGTSISEVAKQKLEALKRIGFNIQFSQKTSSKASDRPHGAYQHKGRRRNWSI